MAEYELPATAVLRVAKSVLPEGVQIGKDVKTALSKAGGLFVLYVIQAANEHCRKAKRSTVTADDILAAVEELEFEELVEPLAAFLKAHRKEKEAKPKKKQAKDAKDAKPQAKVQPDAQREKAKEGQEHGKSSGPADSGPVPMQDEDPAPASEGGSG